MPRRVAAAIRRSLAATLPGIDAQGRMAPRPRPTWPAGEPLRDAAALVLLYPHADAWWLPLTVRGSALPHHRGQVSLPGGRLGAGESVEAAALREAEEEVGLLPDGVEVLGRLTPLVIPVSGHLLHPVVAWSADRPAFRVAPGEVERLIEAPLHHLALPDTVQWEQRQRERAPEITMDVPYFAIDDVRVWGATAMVLAELLALLQDVDLRAR